LEGGGSRACSLKPVGGRTLMFTPAALQARLRLQAMRHALFPTGLKLPRQNGPKAATPNASISGAIARVFAARLKPRPLPFHS
jgi:hypothetical protein